MHETKKYFGFLFAWDTSDVAVALLPQMMR